MKQLPLNLVGGGSGVRRISSAKAERDLPTTTPNIGSAKHSLHVGEDGARRLPIHPAANLFPLMNDDRYAELCERIREVGLLNEITLCDGKILDGRSRYDACLKTGVEPRFKTYAGNPFLFAWNINAVRRDLAADQRAVIFELAIVASEKWNEINGAIAAAANKKRSDAAKAQRRTKDRTQLSGPATTCGASSPRHDYAAEAHAKSSTAMAKAAGTNRGAVERAKKLVRDHPDLAHKVAAGELKSNAAHRLSKRDQVAHRFAPFPKGQYRVIYADPPLHPGHTAEGSGGNTRGDDSAPKAAKQLSPGMTVSDLKHLAVGTLATKDAVLFYWTAFSLLLDALEVLRAWGFHYKTAYVWDKGRGSPRDYHSGEAELLLMCTRGSYTSEVMEKEKQVQKFKGGRHNQKPEEFRQMIDRMYPHGSRIELFCRGKVPQGWYAW
jgi:N6-adenosine-specific RNA methylase IME4